MMQNIQNKIQKMLDNAVYEGKERGIQVAVYYRGELIVDAWAGIADHKTGRQVDGSTLFPVFSTTKGIAATIIHLLAEHSKLDYDMKIADFWPEYGVNGKENTTIRHALNHTAGIPQMPEGVGYKEITDWVRMCAEVAKLAPLSVPGQHNEYHAITFGWIIGEIARRIDGRPFSQIMNEDICKPLGIKDMYVGIPDEVEPRIAILEEPGFDPSALIKTTGPQSISAWLWPLHEWMNTPDARRACIPASNGIMTAKAVARHYAALLPGGVDGFELLPPSRVKIITEPLRLGDGIPLPIGMGYNLGAKDSIMGFRPGVFGCGGYGGSFGFADPEYKLAVGLVNNLLINNRARYTIVSELKKMLGISS